MDDAAEPLPVDRISPGRFRAIRKEAGLSVYELARLLRMADVRTVRRYERGDQEVSGPVSLIMELIDANMVPLDAIQTARRRARAAHDPHS